jgi:putative hydrolase of the HAD superfamily
MAIKHVFFDLDHTLWDFETNSEKAYAKCFNLYQINTDFDIFMSKYRPINEKYWKWYREEKVTKEELKYGRLKEVFDAVNHPVSDDLINKLAEDYLKFLPEFNQLFDGTFEVLDYLKEKYSLHIITNGFEEIQAHKMKQSGLNRYFDQLITSESVGVKKPNPKVFYYALEKANAKAQESMMIGDSLEADVLGALAIGLDAIHFEPFDNNKKNGIKSISSLLELKNYL